MCSLQEAYSIPSFDTVSKKKTNIKKNVLPESTKFYSSSNEYDFDNGKEFAATWNKYSKEDFTNTALPDTPYGELGRSTSGGYGNNRQNMSIKTPYIGTDTVSSTSSYKGRAQDINYWCKETGAGCPDVLPETFSNPPSYNGNCKSYPQIYDIPEINSKTKQEYEIAMNAAVNQDYKSTRTPTMPMRKYDISRLEGYIEDEDNEYITIKQRKYADDRSKYSRAQFDSDNIYRTKDNNVIEHMSMRQGQGNIINNNLYNKNNQYIIDLILFVLSGILIIFLCDQIYRIAALSGMKDTITILNPLLKDLEKLKV